MRREAPISHAAMAELGWVRVDPKPFRSKLCARWAHRDGWRLAHCGHPTAIRPWALVRPDGRMVLHDVVFGGPPNFGRAWSSLREPAEWLDAHLRSGAELREDEGPPHYFEAP